MSDENRIRLIATQPIRGRILDKNGLVLADSRFLYSLIIKPQYVDENAWQKYKGDYYFVRKQVFIERDVNFWKIVTLIISFPLLIGSLWFSI